jgi:hypothetical protein
MLFLLTPLFFFAFVALPAIIAYFISGDAKPAAPLDCSDAHDETFCVTVANELVDPGRQNFTPKRVSATSDVQRVAGGSASRLSTS